MERQKTLIIDASVVVKWFDKEIDFEKAVKIKEYFLEGKTKLIAPELLFLEASNALKYKNIEEDKLIIAIKDLMDLEIFTEHITKSLILMTIKNSIKYDISIYDALYVALAQTHKTKLVTADKKLMDIPCVTSLKDFDY